MNVKHIIFLLIYTIASIASSNAVTSDELIDLEKNESQLEIPPISITTDNTPNISEVKTDDSSNNNKGNVISENENVNPLEQTENSEIKRTVTDVEQPRDDETTTHLSNDSQGATNKSSEEKDHSQENLTIPVFSEWTQMQQMQEAEKKLVELTNSSETNKDVKNETLAKNQIKMRQKNYASPDCGAKILSANPEAQSTSSVLSDRKDEYMLSPCTDRIWFIVELCDSIQAQRVELANFELFSSPLKSVSVSVSNRFPAREWTLAGHHETKSERDVQNFELKDVALFGKFVRVDLQFTNTEHYCPLSFFRIYGTSEIEAFEVENEPDGTGVNTIVDDDFIRTESESKSSETNNKDNILNRAGAAVMSIVQKVLAKSNGHDEKPNNANSTRYTEKCMSMSHNILCETCSDNERVNLHNFIGCKNEVLSNFLDKSSEIKNHLVNSLTCHGFLGFDLKHEKNVGSSRNFLISILPQRYIAAMCNMVASDMRALSLRIENNIEEINSNLVKKGDEVSLKNVSKKEECKNVEVQTTEVPIELPTEVTLENNATTVEIEKEITNQTASEINIFNNVNKFERIIEPEDIVIEKPIVVTELPVVIENPIEVRPIEILPIEVKPPETSGEAKVNGDSSRSNNAPESVFLRLSNRIKTLEKNMTLSTQYLEELSRRYKKQIEDLQTSYNKLQSLFDNLNQNSKESERKSSDEKLAIRSVLDSIDSRSQYMEVILIILAAFLIIQTILIIVLFKRLSILKATVITTAHQKSLVDNESIENITEKTRHGRKRSKQRVRKISAPNILTKGTKTNDLITTALPPTLSRTLSAPNKVCEMIDIKDQFQDIHQAPMLEENDDILIPGFEDLKISDEQEINMDVSERREYDDEEDADTASTASIKTESHKSFRRRLSSPFLKRSSMKKHHADTNGDTWRKAKSESPPKINNSFNLDEEENTLKIRKNNSFKKLLKKFF